MDPRRWGRHGNAIANLVVRKRPRSHTHAESVAIDRHRLGSIFARVHHAADAKDEGPHQWDAGQDDGDARL